jgi:hypothetical protein
MAFAAVASASAVAKVTLQCGGESGWSSAMGVVGKRLNLAGVGR